MYDVGVEGESGPLGATAAHPIWSVDRSAWVPARALQPGERVQAVGRTVQVQRVEERGDEPVFNLEVDADHCYRVGEQGILVHNASFGPGCDPCEKMMLEQSDKAYRNYVTVFGAGELSFEYDIPAPGYSSSPEWDLLQFCKRVAAYFESVADDYENSDLVSRLLYFASSKGKLTFGWDTNDVRSQEDKEYAIYQVSNTEDPVLIATSFSEFIRSVCLASPAADEEMRAFCPAHQLSSP
ncbi:hypothetical protein FTUN_0031 [Frigoriglobus tundricola]|uniref:Intein C-terminal splicing domain-containing protein n=1 Tax=Frigoriglobus tundricola TaxID=2774151 RepID=A0A6M5YEU7_9BACT|nr:hypothetical protein FTUN_0031 [Frigoriglobus tundricola]